MTITSTNSKLTYNGDGSTTVFAITFVFWLNSHIKAILRDAAGNETTWVEGTQYTLTGGSGTTGTLTVKTTPTDYTPQTGETLVIKSVVPETQGSKLPLGGPFASKAVEQMVDQVTRQIQQHSEELTRTISVPETDTATVALPTSITRANKDFQFDGSGNVLMVEPTDASGTAVTATGSTTSRQLAERFSDSVNVADYGAAGGLPAATNLAGFQAAIDATPNSGLQIITVPGGTYAGDFATLTAGSRILLWKHLGDVTYSTSNPVGNRAFDNDVGSDDPTFYGNFRFNKDSTATVSENVIHVGKTDRGAVGPAIRVDHTFEETATTTGLGWTIASVVTTKSTPQTKPTVSGYFQNIAFERADTAQLSGLFGMVSEVGDTRPSGSFGTDPIDGFASQVALEIDVVSNSPLTGFGVPTRRIGQTIISFGGGIQDAGYVLEAASNAAARSHTGTAQAGAATTITLATGAMPVDDYYNTRKVKIYEGTGAGQVRTISDYVGASKIATVSASWTTNPDATSKYIVFDVYQSGSFQTGFYIRQGSIHQRDGTGIIIDVNPEPNADFGAAHGLLVTGKARNAEIEIFSRGAIGNLKIGSDISTAGQAICNLLYSGHDSGGAKTNYAKTRGVVITNTQAAEDGRYDILTRRAGTETLEVQVAGGVKIGSPGGGFLGVGSINMAAALYNAGSQVVSSRATGWATATGTATRTTFATGTVTLPQLAERVKALIDDLHATAGHGLIGT